ncbi:hypothetical protein D9M72_348130 [compost metagenome]
MQQRRLVREIHIGQCARRWRVRPNQSGGTKELSNAKSQGQRDELFAAALLRSVEEMKRAEQAVMHTPEKIAGRKAEALGASESGYRWVKLLVQIFLMILRGECGCIKTQQ